MYLRGVEVVDEGSGEGDVVAIELNSSILKDRGQEVQARQISGESVMVDISSETAPPVDAGFVDRCTETSDMFGRLQCSMISN